MTRNKKQTLFDILLFSAILIAIGIVLYYVIFQGVAAPLTAPVVIVLGFIEFCCAVTWYLSIQEYLEN